MSHWPRLGTVHISLLVYLLAGCAGERPDWVAVGQRGMVATDSPYASQVGLDVLKAGGNAVDAATAVSFALAVTRPQSTGLGGGGFAILRLGDTGEVHVFDFRETAPAASTSDMYVDARKADPKGAVPSLYGPLAAGVPGVVAGRAAMLHRFGTRPLAELIEPSIALAKDGFAVDEHYVEATQTALKVFDAHPELTRIGNYVFRTHLRSGDLRETGERLVQPELASLLEAIARDGPEVFYRGRVAGAIATRIQRYGGIMTTEDLAGYQVVERQPITATYRDFELILMPPPSSGGVCLAEALNILETVDLPRIAESDFGLATHYVVEAMKHAFADRARWLGDSDYADVPVKMLTSKCYARVLSAGLSDEVTDDDLDVYGALVPPDDAGTSHFCVVDQWGNVVVSTETINTSFGSLVAVDEWGLILNNQMDDFTADPDAPNAYGLTQSVRNAVAPHKRPLSSMSPTIVLKDGQLCLVLGASGGPMIITSVLNVLLGVLDYGMSLQEAMTSLRVHHQYQPDEVVFDQTPPGDLANGLRSRGHRLSKRHGTGIVQAIQVLGSQLIGTSDPRKGGQPAGY